MQTAPGFKSDNVRADAESAQPSGPALHRSEASADLPVRLTCQHGKC